MIDTFTVKHLDGVVRTYTSGGAYLHDRVETDVADAMLEPELPQAHYVCLANQAHKEGRDDYLTAVQIARDEALDEAAQETP